MQDIRQFFQNIGRTDISEDDKKLVSDGLIDSMDIMALVVEIENHYKQELNFDFVIPENFENFQSIKNMLKLAIKNSHKT